MDINSHVSQKEMKNLVWFALLAIKTISCDLSLATLKENNEIKCVVAFFFPRLSVTKACNYYFSVPSCHQSRVVEWRLEGWNYDPEEPSSIFSLFSDR